MTKGFRDEYHPNRQVGRDRWPPSPPQSEQPGRGVMIDPFDAEYQPIEGEPGRFRTPDRMMTVGIEEREPPPENLGPLQQFPGTGEGLYSVQPNLAPEQFEQPQQVSNFGPVGDFINRVRPQEIA